MPRDYFKLIPAVHLFLISQDGKILLLRRYNTGYEDGNYSLPAGHIESGETATETMIREAKEEIGVSINHDDLKMVQISHRKAGDQERVDFFLECFKWQDHPKVCESDKCDDVRWFSLNDLPANIIPYVRQAITNYQNKIFYSEFGWGG